MFHYFYYLEIWKLQNCVKAGIALACKKCTWQLLCTILVNKCMYHFSCWLLHYYYRKCHLSIHYWNHNFCICTIAVCNFCIHYFLPYYEGLFFVYTICLHLFSCNDPLNKWIRCLINWTIKKKDNWLKMTNFSCL